MADIADPAKADKTSSKPRPPSRAQQLNKLYALPAPLRTFPLPTFVPHNPISLIHILYTWISQTAFPPSSHPKTLYQGWFSPQTRSVHITDADTIKALWQQGFYGKGTLSRSEPSWLEREKKKRGAAAKDTSEEHTRQRRAERQQVKWERARKEQEAIEQQKLKEGQTDPFGGDFGLSERITPEIAMNSGTAASRVLNGNANHEIAMNGNSVINGLDGDIDPSVLVNEDISINGHTLNGTAASNVKNPALVVNGNVSDRNFTANDLNQKTFMVNKSFPAFAPVGPQELLSLPNSSTESASHLAAQRHSPSVPNGVHNHVFNSVSVEGSAQVTGVGSNSSVAEPPQQMRRRKSVRFSPTVEETTYVQSEPPSPDLAAARSEADEPPLVIENLEHLQLTMEEALFLTYGLGVLRVLDPESKRPYSNKELFTLFRSASPFSSSKSPLPSPDDTFLISYVVYHHFRSLGWVVRGGVKFSVDYLLYNRGPVFSHAEFAIVIIPSYSDPYWSADAATRAYVTEKQKRKWSWLHCMTRVNTQVKKTFVLVYVDIPPPLEARAEEELDITGVLERYTVREFVLKRWSSNRERD